ncbi:MAG: hypothetical protein ABSF90_05125 [Syntrophobacteraceae bacterium]|jgi:hypothetical protein
MNETYPEIELAKKSVNWGTLKALSLVLFLIGAAAFLYQLFGGDAKRAWSAYLTNYVYWTGLAFGTFLLSPVLVLTNATWGRPVKRLSESVAFFLPVSFILLWPLFFGRANAFWWVLHPEEQKAPWLNTPFFFTREGIGLLALAVTAVLITYHSVKSDMEYMEGGASAPECQSTQYTLSAVYVILYAFILTLVAFDMMMSLNPEWFSTLFGAYYFVVSFYAGLAFLAILSTFAVKKMGMGRAIEQKQFHDIGKLLFAFCVVGLDFFYVQFLVIWYGNLPDETRYLIWRVIFDPWAALAWTVLIVLFIVPFVVLLIRKIKMKPVFMTVISIWILIGIWLEKFLLVTPSMVKSKSLPLGIFEVLITIGWLGLFAFCVCTFLQRYPVLAVSDPKLAAALEPEEEKVHLA